MECGKIYPPKNKNRVSEHSRNKAYWDKMGQNKANTEMNTQK
jgi:hypothetical protein